VFENIMVREEEQEELSQLVRAIALLRSEEVLKM